MNNMKGNREGSIEHFLRDALAAPVPTGPPTRCLSAEIAAAFVDAALTPVERAAAVAHAAGCARCQSLLAAVARTSPPAVSGAWWRLSPAGWLVPLSAAATAGVLVWAVMPARSRPQQSGLESPSAKLVVSAPVEPAPVAPAAPPRSEAQPEKRAGRRGAAASGLPATAAAVPPPTVSKGQGAGQESPAAASGNNAAASTREKLADAASAPAPAEPAAALAAAPAAPPAAAPAAPPAATRDAAASLVRVQTAGRPNAALALAEKLTVAATEIVSPDASSRWRIVPGGAVQRSFDGGSSWQVQVTGVTVTLTAGASPSPSVCWLVGPGGTVLLSVDGRAWRRVTSPETADLVAVRATDDHTATVTASDGRMFSTKDGGQTWVRSPGR